MGSICNKCKHLWQRLGKNYCRSFKNCKYSNSKKECPYFEKDKKEVNNLIRFMQEKKYHDSQYEELLNQYIELSRDYEKLENIIKEVRETLINSKEYKMAKEMNLTSKMSVLIEIKDLLDKGE